MLYEGIRVNTRRRSTVVVEPHTLETALFFSARRNAVLPILTKKWVSSLFSFFFKPEQLDLDPRVILGLGPSPKNVRPTRPRPGFRVDPSRPCRPLVSPEFRTTNDQSTPRIWGEQVRGIEGKRSDERPLVQLVSGNSILSRQRY